MYYETGYFSGFYGGNRDIVHSAADYACLLVSAAGQNQNGFDFGAYKSGTYKGRFSGGNSETHLYTGLESKDYTAYLEQLEKAGYKKYADNQVGNNRFAVYLSDKRLVNVSYSPHDASLRVTVENKSMRPAKRRKTVITEPPILFWFRYS